MKTKRWSYGCAALARLYGVDKATVEQWVKRKVFDPSDLQSIYTLKVTREVNTRNALRTALRAAEQDDVVQNKTEDLIRRALNSKDDPSWD